MAKQPKVSTDCALRHHERPRGPQRPILELQLLLHYYSHSFFYLSGQKNSGLSSFLVIILAINLNANFLITDKYGSISVKNNHEDYTRFPRWKLPSIFWLTIFYVTELIVFWPLSDIANDFFFLSNPLISLTKEWSP